MENQHVQTNCNTRTAWWKTADKMTNKYFISFNNLDNYYKNFLNLNITLIKILMEKFYMATLYNEEHSIKYLYVWDWDKVSKSFIPLTIKLCTSHMYIMYYDRFNHKW